MMSTLAEVLATFSTAATIFLIGGESPMISAGALRASTNRKRSLIAENSRQRLTTTAILSALKGFSMKSNAPIFTACAASREGCIPGDEDRGC